MRFLQRPGVASGLAALVCGCLGGLVKITTFYGFWLAAAAFAVHSIWRDRRIKPGVLVSAACLYGMPVLAALLWTRYTDHVRAMNPFAGFITGVPLKQWTLGSLEQRLMLYPTWWVISVRTINDVTGSRAFYLTFATIAWSRKYTAHYAVCIALYIAGMMTFTNLHVIHEYYPYGVGLFVIAAQGFAICSLLEGNRHQRIAGTTMLSLFLMLSGWAYLAGYHKLQRRENTGLTPFATRVAELSRANDVLILYGFDWSPELPYYAQRRALMVRRVDELTPDKVAGAKKAITDLGFRVGPLIACNLPPAVLRAQLALWGADPYQGVAIGGCRAYR
jgi:hypothetical protein